MKAETLIYWVVSALKPFHRNKIPEEKKIRAISLYLHGLSYRHFVHVTFGSRNSVERWFRTVKERTKRFWNNFRSKDWRRVHRFVFLFAFWYNFVRTHSRFGGPPGNVTEWLQEVMPKLS